jgi:extracellular factor (EF) 3-hydroxypalmitic acid methyl ester biosynthesis protein
VSVPVPELSAELFDDTGRAWPARVSPASGLSLRVHFTDGHPAATTFPRLMVTHGARTLTLSACRLVHSDQLVFTEDVYDCHMLVEQGRLKNLLGFFNELPLVLAQRTEVTEGFRGFVADLIYDLTVYKKFFDEQDRAFSKEAPDVGVAAQEVLLRRAGPEFFRFLDANLEKLGTLVRDFSPEQHERHGYYFRQQLWPFILGSAFMERTNLKPRGYAGDATMMQMIYDDRYEGAWAFNKLMHRHPVQHPAAAAVRNRRVLVPRLLNAHLAKSEARPFRVLSVACGPARELQDVITGGVDPKRLELTLLDQDDEALAAARATLAPLAQPLKLTLVNDSVRTLLRDRTAGERWGRFDFIYSMGMFDYLTPPVAKAVLRRLYELLAPGGALVVGNYHVNNPSRFYMAYWLDWVLYYRTEDEFASLAAELPDATVKVGFDDTGCQMFLVVERRA